MIKAQLGTEIFHVKICKPLPHTGLGPSLFGVLRNQTVHSDLLPFEANVTQQ